MTAPVAHDYTLVTDTARFRDICAALTRERRIAIDTEADSMHHYPERVCLVQLATPERTYLLDPLALRDLSPLSSALADPGVLKLLHGADYDIRGLNRDWGLTFAGIFDTHVAARFLGLERVGLAALLQELLGVEIPKDRRIQRADWSKRPLDEVALQYAAADVCHLFTLHDALAGKLRDLGRLGWVEEECARLCEVRHTPMDLTATVLSQSTARKFNGRQLAVLLALYRRREDEARRLDRPPSHILPPPVMTAIAADPGAKLEDLAELTPRQLKRFGRMIRAAVNEGLNGPPVARPAPTSPPRRRPTQAQTQRLLTLKAWRSQQAKDLDVDVALVWPMRSLERLAREPQTLEDELASADVRAWQRDRFQASLQRALATR